MLDAPFLYYAPFFAGLLNLIVAMVVFRHDVPFKLNRRFSLFCLAVALWNLGAFFEEGLAGSKNTVSFGPESAIWAAC